MEGTSVKLSEYLKNISEAPFDVAMSSANQIALYKGSRSSGAPVAAIKADGATTGKTKEAKQGDQTVVVNFLNDNAAKSLFDQLLASEQNKAWQITPEAVNAFLSRYKGVGIPFTNGVVELDINKGQITLLPSITNLTK
jgi:hypothetical protein